MSAGVPSNVEGIANSGKVDELMVYDADTAWAAINELHEGIGQRLRTPASQR